LCHKTLAKIVIYGYNYYITKTGVDNMNEQTTALVANFLPFVIIIAVFYFIIIRPQKKRDKAVREMLASLKVGDEVISIGGIIGKISSIKDDTVTLEVGADKTKIKFERSAIKTVINS